MEPLQRQAREIQAQIDGTHNPTTATMQQWLDQLTRVSAAQDKLRRDTKAADTPLVQVYWSCAAIWRTSSKQLIQQDLIGPERRGGRARPREPDFVAVQHELPAGVCLPPRSRGSCEIGDEADFGA